VLFVTSLTLDREVFHRHRTNYGTVADYGEHCCVLNKELKLIYEETPRVEFVHPFRQIDGRHFESDRVHLAVVEQAKFDNMVRRGLMRKSSEKQQQRMSAILSGRPQYVRTNQDRANYGQFAIYMPGMPGIVAPYQRPALEPRRPPVQTVTSPVIPGRASNPASSPRSIS
jgi:hypothetical protein